MHRSLPTFLCTVAAVVAISASAGAAEPRKLIDITADAIDEGQVKLELTYPGGACDKTGEADVVAADNSIVHVTIPTTREGEICTMQIVPVHFSQVIAVEPGTRSIAATVLAPDGQPLAAGSVDLDAVAPDSEPASSPATSPAPDDPPPPAFSGT